jgi:hypothetical protein
MAITLGKWEALITVPAGGWSDSGNFTLTEAAGGGAQDITIPAGDSFWDLGVDGGSSFLAILKAALEAASANGQTYTVSLAASEISRSGKLTISSTAAFEIAFGASAGAQTLLGLLGNFADPTGSLTSHTPDDDCVRALWLPDQPVWTPTTLTHTGYRRRVVAMSRSAGGAYNRYTGAKVKQMTYIYRGLSQAKVLRESAPAGPESLEHFWDDGIGAEAGWSSGCFLAWFPNAAVANAKLYNPVDVEPEYQRLAENYVELWRVTLRMQTVAD